MNHWIALRDKTPPWLPKAYLTYATGGRWGRIQVSHWHVRRGFWRFPPTVTHWMNLPKEPSQS
jgi:hypothetical protein